MTRAQLLRICGSRPRRVPGGLPNTVSPCDVDARQLTMGIRVEQEHTRHRRVACGIALHHLAEDRRYYTKLRRAKL